MTHCLSAAMRIDMGFKIVAFAAWLLLHEERLDVIEYPGAVRRDGYDLNPIAR
jgi:hypothetical protein